LKLSRAAKKGASNPPWQINGRKPVSWVQVVFAALVDDSEVTISLCVCIGNHAVDLVEF